MTDSEWEGVVQYTAQVLSNLGNIKVGVSGFQLWGLVLTLMMGKIVIRSDEVHPSFLSLLIRSDNHVLRARSKSAPPLAGLKRRDLFGGE